MKGNWIPFHERLVKGPKRELPRAIRFVFLELCLEARKNGGRIDLAPSWSTVDAVCDLLGGSRKEIIKALAELTVSEKKPDNAIVIEKNQSVHQLFILRSDDYSAENSGAAKQKSYRERKSFGHLEASVTNALPEAKVTVGNALRSTGEDRTVQERTGEERESNPAPTGGASAPTRAPRVKRLGTGLPPDWKPNETCVELALALRLDGDSEADSFRDHALAKGAEHVDWQAAFRSWLRKSREFKGEKPSGTVPMFRPKGAYPAQRSPEYTRENEIEAQQSFARSQDSKWAGKTGTF